MLHQAEIANSALPPASLVNRILAVVVIGAVLLGGVADLLRAQGETDSAKAVRHSKTEGDLAKAAQNPVANMVSLPLQYNYSTGDGLGTTSAMVLNVQPVLPLEVGKDWLVVSRTIVPFTNVPLLFIDSLRRSRGIADIQE